MRALGSPDPYRKQIDGVGGATSSTSKAVIISRSGRPDSDVDYFFGQVSIDRVLVDYSGSCGNLASAVGPFAIEEGLVAATGSVTVVRIWQVNTQKRIIAHVPTRDGLPVVEGNYRIDGVPGDGAEIRLEFLDPGGSRTDALLPTGHVVDTLEIAGVGRIEATLLDAANPMVFVRAQDLGLSGCELQGAIDQDETLLARCEAIRSTAAVIMGLAETPEEATRRSPAAPRIAFVAPPKEHVASRGELIKADSLDLLVRVISMGRLHHAIAVTGAVATAIAAMVSETVVHEAVTGRPPGAGSVRIGHPAGVIQVGAEVACEHGRWVAHRAIVGRTARRLMEGFVRVPESVLGVDGSGQGAHSGESGQPVRAHSGRPFR